MNYDELMDGNCQFVPICSIANHEINGDSPDFSVDYIWILLQLRALSLASRRLFRASPRLPGLGCQASEQHPGYFLGPSPRGIPHSHEENMRKMPLREIDGNGDGTSMMGDTAALASARPIIDFSPHSKNIGLNAH